MANLVYEPSKTTHWKNLFPSKTMLLGSHNLNEGEELIAEIQSVSVELIKDQQGKDERVPVVTFVNAPPMVLNITNTKIIASLYGENYDQWAGQSIQIYATKVKAFGVVQSALRIREARPNVGEDTEQYKTKLEGCSTLDELKKEWMDIPNYLKTKLEDIKNLRKEMINA